MLQRRHTCPECGKPLSFEDRQCLFCGAEIHKKLDKRKLPAILAAVLISLALLVIFKEDIMSGIQLQEYHSGMEKIQTETEPSFPYYDVSASQASRTAADYLEDQRMSRQEMIAQLEYEGFTREQAVFGAEAVGLK